MSHPLTRAHKQCSLYWQGSQSPLEALRATSLEARLQSSSLAGLGSRHRPAVSHSPARGGGERGGRGGGGRGGGGRANLLVREPEQVGMDKLTL